MDETLNEFVLEKKKPILGICVGMQLMFDFSLEKIKTPGLSWLSGNFKKINELSIVKKGNEWCISATESANYFEDYTGRGKAFFMIRDNYASDKDFCDLFILFFDERGNIFYSLVCISFEVASMDIPQVDERMATR